MKRFYYHITPVENAKEILLTGLKNDSDGISLIDTMNPFVIQHISFSQIFCYEVVLLQIDSSGITEEIIHDDVGEMVNKNMFFTKQEVIQPKYITLVRKFKFTKEDQIEFCIQRDKYLGIETTREQIIQESEVVKKLHQDHLDSQEPNDMAEEENEMEDEQDDIAEQDDDVQDMQYERKKDSERRFFIGESLGTLMFQITQLVLEIYEDKEPSAPQKVKIIPVEPKPFKLWWEFYVNDYLVCKICYEAQDELNGTDDLCWLEWYDFRDRHFLSDYTASFGYPEWVETEEDEYLFWEYK